jgi:chitinase
MVAGPILMAYFTAWSIYARNYFVADIPADKITHINYAFANVGSDLTIVLGDSWADVEKTFPNDTWDQPLRGNFNQLIKLKAKYPHVQTLISVGGWTWSGKFSDVALTAESRSKFVQSCVTFVQKYSFDGLDIDWEYPVEGGLPGNIVRPVDKQNYVLLLQELRKQFDAAGVQGNKTYLLTVASAAGAEKIGDLDLPGMTNYLDWFNVMTYDFHGSWEAKTGHNTPVYKNDNETATDIAPTFIKSKYNANAAIQAYIAGGVPRSKIVMGLALYGHGWQGVTSTDQNGYSQNASSTPPMGTWEPGSFDYDDLKKNYLPTYTRYWDNSSKVPFLFNTQKGMWLTYDDLESNTIKNNYILQEKLGGAMFWEFSCDRNVELIGNTYTALFGGQTTTPGTTTSTQTTTPNTNTTSTTATTTGTSTTATTTETSTTATTTSGNIPEWGVNISYRVGDKVTYNQKVYQCLQAHTSISTWTPDETPALWELIGPARSFFDFLKFKLF